MKIMIFKEKHGNRYFDASTTKLLEKACLKIVKERLKDGWYNVGKEPTNPFPKLDMSNPPEAFKENESIWREAQSQMKNYNFALKRYNKDKSVLDDATKAVKEKNGKLARQVIEWRRDFEYEDFEIEELEKV